MKTLKSLIFGIMMLVCSVVNGQSGNTVYTKPITQTSYCEGDVITLNFYMTGSNVSTNYWYQFWVGPCSTSLVFATITNGGCGTVVSTIPYTSNYIAWTGVITWTVPNTYGSSTGTQYNIGVSYSSTQFVNGVGVVENPSSGQTITIYEKPTTPSITGTTTICKGNSTTLTGSGGVTYSWNPSGATTSSVVVSPSVNTTYTLTVGDGNGCGTATNTVLITVRNPPTASVSADKDTICKGSSVTLTGTGSGAGTTYSWSPSNKTTAVIIESPTVTTTYTLTTTTPPCSGSATATITIIVDPCLSIAETKQKLIDCKIYPNPAKEEFTLEYDLEENSDIVLVDVILELKINDSVLITDYHNHYFTVTKGEYTGFINEVFIQKTSQTVALKKQVDIEQTKKDSLYIIKLKTTCNLYKKVDEFDGTIKYTVEDAGGEITFFKDIKNGIPTYYLSIWIKESGIYTGTGVVLILENGEKINKPTAKVNYEYTASSFYSTTFIKLNNNDIELLKKSGIKKYKLYISESYTRHFIETQRLFNCLVKANN